jgi:cellulose synthase/poly-beta-1,6-N-acetylglucosamine synthase-like glycosyltransferase
MPISLAILWAVLSLCSALLLVYWGVGLGRIIRTHRHIPTARAGVALAAEHPPMQAVCIVIPAHNEEAAIGGLLESLKAQNYPNLRVILCLDRCTDGTAAVVRKTVGDDGRFRAIEIRTCPDGWAGKVNAAWTGAHCPEARSAEFLLFADADTWFHPDCVAATVALLEHRKLDLLSLLSTLTADRWFEKLVQPAAGLELIRQYPIERANRATRRRAFANGQFMLFRRAAYDAVGGHEAVRDELLEDIALARRIAETERPAGLLLADGMLRCRMYESWDAFRRGWKRIYVEAAKCKVRRLRQAAMAAGAMGAVLPLLAFANLWLSAGLMDGEHQLAAVAGVCISLLGLGAWGASVGATYRIARVPLIWIPGFILGSLLAAGILREAARDLRSGTPVSWGGRTYVRSPRD